MTIILIIINERKYMLPIVQLEHMVKKYEQIDIEESHKFYDGLYMRSIFIPAGSLIVGKRHRHSTLNILLKGKMQVSDGTTTIEVEAPYVVETLPNTKKAALALEDSIWANIHATNNTNLDELEEEFIITEEEYNNLITYKEKQCLG